jgi:hypothetical protein
MKVEIVGEIAHLKDAFPLGTRERSDTQVLVDFRAALSGSDSFFYLQDCVAVLPGRSDESQGACFGQFVLVFRRLDLNDNRDLYSMLLQTLQGLLKTTSSSDALFAKLCVTAPATEGARASGLSLVLQLEAIGSTPGQAEIRWEFGLVHVQDALISASRLLRQHLAKPSV